MKFAMIVNKVSSASEIPGYWTNDDYVNILEELEFPDARNSDPAELRELVEMSISDLETNEAAELLLNYKLKDDLSSGQIQNLSHEMQDDNEAEQNANIELQYALFNINRLLYTSFNGRFPNPKATKVEFELKFKEDPKETVSKEHALKAICNGLDKNSPIQRLFKTQIDGTEPFTDAEKIVWELHNQGSNQYQMITSDFWVNKEDFVGREFSGEIDFFEG